MVGSGNGGVRLHRTGLMAVATALAVGLAAWAAIGTIRARTRVRAAALASLRNYAAAAAEQFANGYESLIRQSFVPILPPAGDAEPAARADPRPIAELVAGFERQRRDPCRCLIAPGPAVLFRLDLRSGEAVTADAGGRPVALPPEIAAAVRRHADGLPRLGSRYGLLMTPVGGATHLVVFTRRVDSATGARFGYGLAIPAGHLADPVFGAAFRTTRLVPRHLLGQVAGNEGYLAIDVELPGGEVIHASSSRFRDGPSDGLTMPALRGGLTVRARLNPAVKDALIPGGVPAPLPLRELGLIGLSLALLVAIAAVGIRAADLARIRADFAASVTHELRTPLTQIRLAAETLLLGRSRDAESARTSLASIVAETERLQQLVGNILHYTRAERRATRLEVGELDLSATVREVVKGFRPVVADRGIEVEVDTPDRLPVRADDSAIRQMLLNLLDNAARYGPARQTIQVAARRVGTSAEVLVEDEGPGIPIPDRERVWEPFVRLDRDRDPAATGTGLGLAVVRELVRAHRGSCRAEARAGGGTRMVIRLPLAVAG